VEYERLFDYVIAAVHVDRGSCLPIDRLCHLE